MKIFLTLISLALFESSNGIDRKPSENPLFSTLYLAWAVGTDPEPIKLLRQQIYFENGEPASSSAPPHSPENWTTAST